MIKSIRTYGAYLYTPVGKYLVIDVEDISESAGALYAIVTNIDMISADEQNMKFHVKPFAIIVNGSWQLMFDNDTPKLINVWVEDKEVNPYANSVLSKDEWDEILNRDEKVTDDEEIESN